MSAFGMVEKVAQTYPETSPFQLGTPVFNLLPVADPVDRFVTNDVREAAVAIARAHNGYNVFANMYGSNPLPLIDKKWTQAKLPLTAYSRPPPIQRVQLPASAELLETIGLNSHAATVIIQSVEWSTPRMLKVVSVRLVATASC